MTTALIYDDRFLDHDTGPGHPERPDRLRAVKQHLQSAGLWERLTHLTFEPADMRWILANHDQAYVERLRDACNSGAAFIDAMDSAICAATFDIARLAAGGVLRAVDAVMTGEADNVFCAVRPPGHHAEQDRSMGFCMFNNVAIAARYAIEQYVLERVAIVDFDVHHGNGTQHSFEDRTDVLFISLHEDPQSLYPGTGFVHEAGTGQGAGFTLNMPFEPGADDDRYDTAFNEQVIPKLDAFAPQLVLISAGFDAAASDPLAHQQLTPDCFARMASALHDAADRHCNGKLVSTLEGGYDLNSLAACVAAHLKSLAG